MEAETLAKWVIINASQLAREKEQVDLLYADIKMIYLSYFSSS